MNIKTPAAGNGGLKLIKQPTVTNLPNSRINGTNSAEVNLLPYPFTDSGNAERLVLLHGCEIHYCPDFNCWMIWDGTIWRRDRHNLVQRLARQTARLLYAQAATVENPDDREEIEKFARRSESAGGIRAAIECAKSIEGVSVLSEDFDRDVFLFNCLNGTLDLEAGELREHRRKDLITKVCPVRFDWYARCPRFDKFIDRIFSGDTDVIAYVKRSFGYALSASVSEKAIFCLVGKGDNGKTTLLEAIRYVMGDYAGQIMVDSLLQKSSNNITSAALADLADLKGKRFVTTSEAEHGAKLAEAHVKQLTGMGSYKACRKYENPTEFAPTWKIFMDTNYRPIVRGQDEGIWTRLKLINFSVRIPKGEIDKNLLKTLKNEAAGILTWAVEGFIEWQSNGLQEPAAIQRSVDAWRYDSDQYRDFLETVCELDPSATCPISTLSEAFDAYRKAACLDITQRQFSAELERRGCTKGRNKQQRFWRGIRLKPG